MRELTAKFVPVADEVWRLQNDGDPECRFFRRMVQGNEEPSRGSMQGTYVFAPNGQLLGRINSNSAVATRKVLTAALQKFEELPGEALEPVPAAEIRSGFRWEQSYPEDGLVLMRTARDLPRDHDPKAAKSKAFNRDAVWFSRAEARSFLPDRLEPGAVGMGSRVLASRLAQLVLVDNVRGQTLPYHDSEVQDAAIRSEVLALRGDIVEVELRIETLAKAKGPWLFRGNYWKPRREYPHSIRTWLWGKARYDRKQKRFVAFDAVALGQYQGRTALNGRAKHPRGPLGFVLQLAPRSWRVAPTFINVYDAAWVKQPR